MGGLLKNGEWTTKEAWENNDDGEFDRQTSAFRDRIEKGGRFEPQKGRYHLYVSYACPWAHRTLITRALKGLEDAVSISVVHYFMGDDGWTFEDAEGTIPDPILDADYLRELYVEADSGFTGRVTVPVLWDREHATIVNNESAEIMRMFDVDFDALAKREVDLYPHPLQDEIDQTIDAIYEPINNGVYRCGFAGTQGAYDKAFDTLFSALDHWDAHLAEHRYLCGERLTEADICMFTTLVRFDPVYYVHFKCNGRHIFEYENLSGYMREIYQLPGVAQTVNMTHIKRHYYSSHENINPKRFVAKGPLDHDTILTAPHGREHLDGHPPEGLFS